MKHGETSRESKLGAVRTYAPTEGVHPLQQLTSCAIVLASTLEEPILHADTLLRWDTCALDALDMPAAVPHKSAYLANESVMAKFDLRPVALEHTALNMCNAA